MESQTYGAGDGGAAAYPGAGESPTAAQQPDADRMKDEARRGVQTAKDEARAAAQQVSQHAGEVGRQVKDSARAAAEQTKRKATDYAQQAQQRGMEMLDEQRHHAASQLQTVGEAVHRAADKFREERDENIAGYVDAVADEVDRCARYLEQRDLRSLLGDTQQFARRNPEWFLGGMFFAGLALSRFLKAGSPNREHDQRRSSAADTGPWEPTSTGTNDNASAAVVPTGITSPASLASTPSSDTNPAMPGDSGPACGPVA
jgi:vacuolar-type H+-ATPase subunit E/Vma4